MPATVLLRALIISRLALGGTIYQDWSPAFTTRTQIFAAEDKPVFAKFNIDQDFTAVIIKGLTATAGARWARYTGGQEVSFLSLGARYYFDGGSIAYRVTRTAPDGRRAFPAHLINLSIDDGQGEGKTQLWISAGAASLMNASNDNLVSQNDYGVVLRRVQPLSGSLALVVSAGYTSYALPSGRTGAPNFGLGFLMALD